ncbi:MAG: hypothetical protein MUC96_08940 [Myxococcaceae bacterium]|nr:hypothetical protein [Myxococcaceae bacterium]
MPRPSSLGKFALGLLGGLPPSSCYETITLPDGGRETDYVCGEPARDAGSADAGPADAGPRTDAGQTDGGVDAGP